MSLTPFDYYLLAINVIGFIAASINFFLYAKTAEGQIDNVVTAISILGGSLGIIVSILLFERKPIKEIMMSRVFIACVFVIQVIIVLIVKGVIADHITLAFWKFFGEHRWLLYYLLAINVVAFFVYLTDKIRAVENRSRIRIITLLGIAFIGGSIGSLLSMYIFRHKTQKDYFTVGVPLIIVMQVVVLFYLMNIA